MGFHLVDEGGEGRAEPDGTPLEALAPSPC